MRTCKFASPMGPAESPPNVVLPMGITELAIPMGPAESRSTGVSHGESSKLVASDGDRRVLFQWVRPDGNWRIGVANGALFLMVFSLWNLADWSFQWGPQRPLSMVTFGGKAAS